MRIRHVSQRVARKSGGPPEVICLPARNPWILFMDADGMPTDELVDSLRTKLSGEVVEAAFDTRLSYVFARRQLKHGHRVTKRAFVYRERVAFPVVNDLKAPGMGELEGHYQPEASGPVGVLRGRLLHDDRDPVRTWFDRHNRYSDWEAYLRVHSGTGADVGAVRSKQGKVFNRVPFKPLVFFTYSYLLRGGFMDGRAGLDYALALSTYYWQIGVKTRELRRPATIR